MTLEWCPISLPQKLRVVDQNDFGIAADEIQLSRGCDLWLRISADAAGRCSDLPPGIPGSEFEASPIRLVTGSKQDCVLDGYRRTNATVMGQTRSQIEGRAISLSVSFGSGEPFATVDWLTNLPDLLWTGLTERPRQKNATRVPVGSPTEKIGEGFSLSWDHVDLELNLPTISMVRIGTVPEKFVTEGISVERPGFLEYRHGTKGFPNDESRNTVRRALEFLFGTGLGVLGHSEVDQAGQPISAVSRSALVPGGFGGALRPALLHEDWRNGVDAPLVAELVRRYIELEPEYGLNGAVWRYLYARSAPLEMKAGYVGAALEILRRGFYARSENKPRSQLMPSDRWSELAAGMETAIAKLTQGDVWLELRDAVTELKGRLPGLNDRSGSRLNLLFLKDLGLGFGKTEKYALQARNDAAHANELDPGQAFASLKAYRAAHTLFARVLLAILGVPVRYFDYSTSGFPVRELKEAQGDSRT